VDGDTARKAAFLEVLCDLAVAYADAGTGKQLRQGDNLDSAGSSQFFLASSEQPSQL
jgi:hypothetical protein